jgi:hypothetical protein
MITNIRLTILAKKITIYLPSNYTLVFEPPFIKREKFLYERKNQTNRRKRDPANPALL